MLYTLICGYPPFLADNEDEVKKKILKRDFKFGGIENLNLTLI